MGAIVAFLPRVIVAIVIVIITAAIAAGVKGLILNTLGGLSYGKILAIIAGVIIVGAGGGLIKPMQLRWESILNRAAEEVPNARARADAARTVAQQVQQAKDTLQGNSNPAGPSAPLL